MARKAQFIFSLLILFASLSNVQGGFVGEIEDESVVSDVRPLGRFVESDSASADEADSKTKEPALLDGLEVQGGKIAPDFDPNVFNYTVEPSTSIDLLEIIAKVSLRAGDGNEKYKVKTKVKGDEKEKIKNFDRHSDSLLHSKSDEVVDPSVVEVHVSASDREAVTYYLNFGVIVNDPERSSVWTVLFQILFWTGIAIAVGVVGVFGYAAYLTYTAVSLHSDANASNGGDYQRFRDGEGSSGA